jgi:hypothetical protein
MNRLTNRNAELVSASGPISTEVERSLVKAISR